MKQEIVGCAIESVISESDRATVYRAQQFGRTVVVKVRKARTEPSQHLTLARRQDLLAGVHFETMDDGHRVTVMPEYSGNRLVDELREGTAIEAARVHHVIDRLLHVTGPHPALRTDQIFIGEGSHPQISVFGADTPFPLLPFEPRAWPLDIYTPPELDRDPPPTKESNVYAIGVIAIELLSGEITLDPDAARDPDRMTRQLRRRKGLPDELVGAIRDCLAKDPYARPDPARLRGRLSSLLRYPVPTGAHTSQELAAVPPRKRGHVPRDDRERTLLDELRLQPKDAATRQVYADWLEEHGFDLRAELVRGKPVKDPAPDGTGWRALFTNPAIEKCNYNRMTFEFACPLSWDALDRTRFDDVRSCKTCSKPVYFVGSIDEAYARGARGECIAIDSAVDGAAAIERYEAGVRGPRNAPVRPVLMGKPAVPTLPVMPMPVARPPVTPSPFEPVGPMPTSNPPPPGWGKPPLPPEPPEKKTVLTRLFGWIKRDS